MPAEVKKYADGMQGDLTKMVSGDAAMMKDLGLGSPKEVAKLKLDYSKAFVMQKVDAGNVEGAKSVGGAVSSTGIYYVPMCDAGKCAMMAAFRVDPATDSPAFESVGQPNLTRQIADAKAGLAGDVDPSSVKVVEYNEAGVGFLLAKKTGSGEEILIPQSEAEAQALVQALGRPAGETDSRGRPRFALTDLKMVAKTTRERAETEKNEPETGMSLPEEFDADRAPNTPDAVRTADAVSAPVAAPPAILEQSSAVAAVTAATTAEESAPRGTSPLRLGAALLVVLLGMGAWLFSRRHQ